MYNHKSIEKKWQEKWAKSKIYEPDLDKAKKPYYNLMMFPYPSAEGLHVGNMYAFTHSDAYGRFKRLQGYDIFQPIGLDGFGIHSENYAIKIGEHIRDVSARTEANFYKQLRMIGNQYDWSRTVETYKSDYYKWTQWLFLKMHEKGLAYRKKSHVNWCAQCKTVLSDEQIVGGVCERCGTATEKKEMKQWFFRITNYANKLLKNLDDIDWSDDVKTIQKNWIGKSIGTEIKFLVTDKKHSINVFTTRPDTIFGCTFLVICPEHNFVRKLKDVVRGGARGAKNWDKIKDYVDAAKNKSDLARTDLNKDKSGIEIKGIKAINPVNDEEIPIFIADYVLPNYGTGAIMAVPAHDERDFEFAQKYNLPIREVVRKKTKTSKNLEVFDRLKSSSHSLTRYCQTNISISQNEKDVNSEPAEGFKPSNLDSTISGQYQTAGLSTSYHEKKQTKNEESNVKCFTGAGININSNFLNDLTTLEAKEEIIKWLENKELGKGRINYKLRDWCVSRQRYWGPPIPMIYCEECDNKKYNYILLHGYGDNSKKYFFPFLSKELKKQGHNVFVPDLPNSGKPNINDQVEYVLKNFKIDENTIILGHSLGGVLAMRLVEKINKKIRKLVILDSFLRPEFTDGIDRSNLAQSCDWKFKFSKIKANVKKIIIIADINFPTVSRTQSIELKKKLDDRLIFINPEENHFRGKEEARILDFLINDGWNPVKEDDLPVRLPEMDDFLPDGTGKGPLNKIDSFVNIHCPDCGAKSKRETDVSDPFVDSCWYYLRYLCTEFDKDALDKKRLNKWMPVNMYIGGKEHSVLHLLYSRFVNMVMHELGYTPEEEPFLKFRAHGLVVKDGAKMSKSKGNVVNPDKYIERFGADTVRMYLMFMGDMRQGGDWRDAGAAGIYRFLNKVYGLIEKVEIIDNLAGRSDYDKLNKLIHKTIKNVGHKLENLKFNTAVSDLMVLVNKINEIGCTSEELGKLAILLSPFAPHLAEELWLVSIEDNIEKKGESVFSQIWPEYDNNLAQDDLIDLVVQVNSKIRDKIVVVHDITESEAKKVALNSLQIKKWVEGKEVIKVIFVPGRLINIVVK